MQLATSDITLRLDGAAIHLRPSLRAALRLERRHGGFDAIARAVADGSVSVILDVVRETAGGLSPSLTEELFSGPLHGIIAAITPAILDLVIALAGIDADEAPKKEGRAGPTIATVTWSDHHRQLFKIATGWLGWNPADAWNATPAEVLAAYEGRLDMLKAIFGENSGADTKPDLSLDDKFSLVFGGFARKKAA